MSTCERALLYLLRNLAGTGRGARACGSCSVETTVARFLQYLTAGYVVHTVVLVFRALSRLLRTVDETPSTTSLTVLTARVAQLESAETLRAAEHHAMVDQLDRLYKRLVARISRQNALESTNATEDRSESPLALRRRLRGE